MSIKFFPTNFVAMREVDNHAEIKAELLPRMLYLADKWKDDPEHRWDKNTRSKMVTTYNHGVDKDLANIILEKHMNNIVWNLMREVVAAAGIMAFKDAGVTNLWWNVYQKGDWAELHNHSTGQRGHPNYSGVYFLDIEGENTLEFVSPVTSSTHPIEASFHTMRGNEITEGNVVIFPASLLHQVKPAPGRRVTISFNISCEYPGDPKIRDCMFDPSLVVRPS